MEALIYGHSTTFTDANKSSYIDSFVDRGMDCQRFIHELYEDIINGRQNWYL